MKPCERIPVTCGPCRKSHRRCSGDGHPCRRVPGTRCTYDRNTTSETAPLSEATHASETIPEVTNTKERISTDTEHPPSTNQYLLVLSYLFLTSRDPYDNDAILRIIARDHKEWEQNFYPQYPQPLSWWIAIRGDLTQQGYVPAVSIEDMKHQMRYLLYLIGQLSSHQSDLYSDWESSSYPRRPFGIKASIALTCYCFNGIKSVQGYESLDIWSYNRGFLFTMAVHLRSSPIFRDGITLIQLEHMIAGLRTALHRDDERTYLLPWSVRIDDSDITLEYYRNAIKALNPELLPEIQSRWAKELPQDEVLTSFQNWDFDDHAMIGRMASALARVFQGICDPVVLYHATRGIPQIMESKPDRDVITEIIHVREWERLHSEGLSEWDHSIRVMVVPP